MEHNDIERIVGNGRTPNQHENFNPKKPNHKSWWAQQSILNKVGIVILAFVALYIVTEILNLAERLLYQIYQVGIWGFWIVVAIVIISSLFKKR